MTILDEIFAHKREEVAFRRVEVPISRVRLEAEAREPALDFVAALRAGSRKDASHRFPALIAEVKCASPSRGVMVTDFDPLRLARTYQENGASAISVLTDERYFKGHLDYLRQISGLESHLPLLRKDFLWDPYQVYEARAAGADAVLLIAAYLEPDVLRDLHTLSLELGMAPLVEVHSREELDKVLDCGPVLVGINNRDLRDFTVRFDTVLSLRQFVPQDVCLVAESGIHTPEDVARLAAGGVDAVLIGEALVTAPDVALKVRNLAGLEKNG